MVSPQHIFFAALKNRLYVVFYEVTILNYHATGASFKYNYVNDIAEETECGPSRGVEGNVLVAECMNDITLHLASCHLSKCSKVND